MRCDDALDLQLRGIEVEEEAVSLADRPQVRPDDRKVHVLEGTNRLELDDDLVLDEEIQAVPPNFNLVIENGGPAAHGGPRAS